MTTEQNNTKLQLRRETLRELPASDLCHIAAGSNGNCAGGQQKASAAFCGKA